MREPVACTNPVYAIQPGVSTPLHFNIDPQSNVWLWYSSKDTYIKIVCGWHSLSNTDTCEH